MQIIETLPPPLPLISPRNACRCSLALNLFVALLILFSTTVQSIVSLESDSTGPG